MHFCGISGFGCGLLKVCALLECYGALDGWLVGWLLDWLVGSL